MLEIRNTAEIKKCLYQIIKQDIAKEGIAELKEFSIETAKTEKKNTKKTPQNPRTKTTAKGIAHM